MARISLTLIRGDGSTRPISTDSSGLTVIGEATNTVLILPSGRELTVTESCQEISDKIVAADVAHSQRAARIINDGIDQAHRESLASLRDLLLGGKNEDKGTDWSQVDF